MCTCSREQRNKQGKLTQLENSLLRPGSSPHYVRIINKVNHNLRKTLTFRMKGITFILSKRLRNFQTKY
jgi:hypothetical protein